MRRTTRDRRLRKPLYKSHSSIQPNNDTYNPELIPQFFQISVNVLEARKLAWPNPQVPISYVMVVLGRKKHRTTVRKGQEDPCYGEYLIFDMYMSVREIRRSSLWLVVMEPKCYAPPRMLGEATLDLVSVWNLPSHQMYHKWLPLSLPKEGFESVGFLKVDVSIVARGGVQVMPAIVSENRAADRLQLATGAEQQPACYSVTVHAALALPGAQPHHDRRIDKGLSTYVCVSFCGLMGKTSVQKNSKDPQYNEQISIVEMFPNTNQVIKFEVCLADTSFHRVIASTELRLEDVSHDGENGFLPTFGPSLLHMYSALMTTASSNCPEDGPYHKGALLVSLKTVVPYYQQSLRTISVETVPQMLPDHLWVQEECFTYCAILEISMLDKSLVRKSTGVALSLSEIPSDRPAEEEFAAVSSFIKATKHHYTGPLQISDPRTPYGYVDFFSIQVLQLCSRLPDFRFRMYRNNIILRIVTDLEQHITRVEKRLDHYDYKSPTELMDELHRAIDDAAGNILKFLDIVNYSSNCSGSEDSMQQYATELDQLQLNIQKEEIEKVYNLITKRNKSESMLISSRSLTRCCTLDSLAGTRKGVKCLLADVKKIAESIKNIIFEPPDGWPDLVIWLLHEGSRVAYKRIKISESIYSVIPEQCGLHCAKIQTIYFKPIKCSKHGSPAACVCISGKMELILWTGLFRQRHAFSTCLPKGFHCKFDDNIETRHNKQTINPPYLNVNIDTTPMMLETRAFIYRAKLTNEGSHKRVFNTFVRINALRCSKDTLLKKDTVMPVWNQVLKIQKLAYGTHERLYENPPFVLVEVFNVKSPNHFEILGRFQMQPVVEDRQDYAPKLQWYEIYRGSQRSGQILMSVQLLPIPEQMLKNTLYYPVAETYYETDVQLDNSKCDIPEALPVGLIPRLESYKADIYWWGLRDVNITKKPLVVLEIDDLVIKSDMITGKKSNSNFPNGKMSKFFESQLNEEYFPTLSIKLYDSSTFGRTLFLGTNVIKRPNKFLIEWIPKKERIACLKSVSVMSSDFYHVGGEMLYVKKRMSHENDVPTSPVASSVILPEKTLNSFIKMMYRKKEPREEEITLLPVYVKENDQIKVVKKMPRTDCGDWWTRYLLSEKLNPHEETPVDYITIYDYELEFQPEFSKFKDWCSTLKLYNGKKTGIPEKDEQLQCGYLKAGIVMYRWPPPQNTVAVAYNGVELERGFFQNYPENKPTKYTVRVYVVKCINLHSEVSEKADPYVVVNCGKRRLGDRKNHIANSTDPLFGKMFEFTCSFPEDYSMIVSVFDYDPSPPDELIGSTSIDLEDRVFSKHRARVGLSVNYSLAGPSKWRDNTKPSAILDELCAKNHLPPPSYPDPYTVVVNSVEYKDSLQGRPDKVFTEPDELKENICLSILHKWHTLPLIGYQLVPEHVETRSLYHPDVPGFERGKIQMWVDIFPMGKNSVVPPPRQITPRRLEEYELRVIVWDVRSILLVRQKIRSWKTADIYVKIWIGSKSNAQQTDIHHNSLSGEGNFNWRMVFNFLYHHIEGKMVVKEQCPFTEYEQYVVPNLKVQVIQNREDDILGVLTLDLRSMYKGSQSAKENFKDFDDKTKYINLFSVKSTRAWWPLTAVNDKGDPVNAGVIDLEMTLLPKERAVLMPVGVGRAAPMPLPEPVVDFHCSRKHRIFQLDNYVVNHSRDILIFFAVIAIITVAYIAVEVNSFILYTYRLRSRSLQSQNDSDGIIRTILDSSIVQKLQQLNN